ncbi:MAG: YjgP/YjgQ family permease [Opitutae bacterium]|nr:YjgP/YjgQ family permease [Opitutae bacterium]
MKVYSSKTIRNYIFGEILGVTLLSTLVLTIILLYGNLSKNDEALFRALSISPILFVELISLMIPFALSLGLPFGFSLAVIFCVGRWSADREILAMQSLGIKRSLWATPVFYSALLVTAISCFASLHWSPVSRGTFEHRVRNMMWENFQSWIDSGREIAFNLDGKGEKNLMGGFDSELEKQITQATLSIGNGVGDNWENVRILLWDLNRELLAILHAKKSTVVKDRESGSIELFLEQVDYESLQQDSAESTKQSRFVSFEKWKQPMKFSIDTPVLERNMKRLSLLEFMDMQKNGDLNRFDAIRAYNHFNKYASLGCSPISLSALLVSIGVRSGRKETYANLFIGVLICLFYFAIGTTLGQSIGSNGYGWWIANFVFLVLGTLTYKKSQS